jgi:DNA-binding Lrp family transcriptional regulator
VRAYVLIQTEVGQAAAVVRAVRSLPGVVAADNVTGSYDVIVAADAESLNELARLVVSRVQATPGITHTLTCPVVDLDE